MRRRYQILIVVSCICFFLSIAISQDSLPIVSKFLPKYFEVVSCKVSGLGDRISKNTRKSLNIMHRMEKNLNKKLVRIDLHVASNLFSDIQDKYEALQENVFGKNGKHKQQGIIKS